MHRLKLNTSKILLIFNFSKVRAVIQRLLSKSLQASLTSELTIRKKYGSLDHIMDKRTDRQTNGPMEKVTYLGGCTTFFFLFEG